MASENCVKCSNPVRPRQEGLQCDACHLWQHRTCDSGITQEQYRSFNRNKTAFDWKCCICTVQPTEAVEMVSEAVEMAVEMVSEAVEMVSEDVEMESADASFTVERPYQRPDPIIESSMSQDEGEISVFVDEDPQVIYSVEECGTSRGKKKLFDNQGFCYTIKTEKKTTVWRCCKRSVSLTCPASVIQDGNTFTKGLKNHVHPAEPGIHTATKIKVLAKKEAKDNVFSRSCPSIAERAMSSVGSIDEPIHSRPPLAALIRSVQRVRQALRPSDPTDVSSAVLRAVHKLLPEDIALEACVVDFEAGLWQAIRRRFADIRIQGCVFHWTQAVFRKIQEKGFQTVYNQKKDAYSFFRKLMALPFLPQEQIKDMFYHLKEKCPEELAPVFTYVEDTWITSSMFPVEQWCVFMLPVRTNNDVEGWHNRLNSRVNSRGPIPFYLLICELYMESTKIELDIVMMSEGSLRRLQRKKYQQVEGKLFRVWERYNSKEITTSKLLRKISHIYGPPTDK